MVAVQLMEDDGSIYEEIQLEEMDWVEDDGMYYYPCPCGDVFELSKEDFDAGKRIAKCPSCSLKVKVLTEDASSTIDVTDAINEEHATSSTANQLCAFLTDHAAISESTAKAVATTFSLRGCVAMVTADRPAFLRELAALVVEKLSDRQKIANTIGKAARAGEIDRPETTADLLSMLCEDGATRDANGDIESVSLPSDVPAQLAPAADARPQAIPRLIFQTNKTPRVGRRALDAINQMLTLNPTYSYKFFDDARCASLIREHFAPCVLRAFEMLRQGAAKADLWRYCALYVHGGVYLDLDSAIVGPLSPPPGGGGGGVDGEPALIAKPDVRRVFMYDAEANLIQWCFAAAPNDPVLLRAIELSTARILAREPNIFIATGPSVFTDAFIALHSEGGAAASRGGGGGSAAGGGGGGVVYASRTSMQWSERLQFLQRHGAIGEESTIVRTRYDGYEYADVYAGGEAERYLPTWGSEPTHGLYRPPPCDLESGDGIQNGCVPSAATQGGGGGQSSVERSIAAGTYCWSGGDAVEDGEQTTHLSWRCTLTLSPPRADATTPPARVRVLRGGGEVAAAVEEGEAVPPANELYAGAILDYESVATAAASAQRTVRRGRLRGVWRRAPGKPEQLHCFEWRMDAAEAAANGGVALTRTEAPSVMTVVDGTRLHLEGWEGGREVEGLATRIGCGRRRAQRGGSGAEAAGLLVLPIIFEKLS